MAEKTDMNKSISKVLVSEEQLRARCGNGRAAFGGL